MIRNEHNEEFIVLGKGIGFGKKQGDIVDEKLIDRKFKPVNDTEANQMIELFSQVPPIYLEITEDIVNYAQKKLSLTLNHHIYIALTDHIHYAIERTNEGITISNRIFWEIKQFFKQEFEIGLYALQAICENTGILLPEEEAANIAFHIANMENESEDKYDTMKSAKLIGEITNMITYIMHLEMRKDSMNYARFITHLRYFSQRFFSGKFLQDEDDYMYTHVGNQYPKALRCAEKVGNFIEKSYHVRLPKEEIVYLAIHIARISK